MLDEVPTLAYHDFRPKADSAPTIKAVQAFAGVCKCAWRHHCQGSKLTGLHTAVISNAQEKLGLVPTPIQKLGFLDCLRRRLMILGLTDSPKNPAT